jgi:hypothetical protein
MRYALMTISEKDLTIIKNTIQAISGLIPDHLLRSEDDEEFEGFEDLFNDITDNTAADCHYGASKIVIAPWGCNYVIKTPIYGYYYEEEDCYNTEHNYFRREEVEFDGAASEDGNNYCEDECTRYQELKDEGLEMFFAETEYFGTFDGVKYYIQRRVDSTNAFEYGTAPSEDSKNKAKNYEFNLFSVEWTAKAIEYYGEEKVKHLLHYLSLPCNDNFCSDFHAGNYGYYKDEIPVIFDYSGYNS